MVYGYMVRVPALNTFCEDNRHVIHGFMYRRRLLLVTSWKLGLDNAMTRPIQGSMMRFWSRVGVLPRTSSPSMPGDNQNPDLTQQSVC